jgi:hypothetical protein
MTDPPLFTPERDPWREAVPRHIANLSHDTLAAAGVWGR